MTLTAASVGLATVLGVFATRLAARRARRERFTRLVAAHLVDESSRSASGRRPTGGLWRYPPTWLVVQLRELQVPVKADDAWRWWRVGTLGAAAVGMVVGGPVLALIAAGVAAGAPVIGVAVLRSRAEASYDATLALFLDAVARGVRSGGSITSGINEASMAVRGAVAADTQRVVASIERGQPVARALDDWSAHRQRGAVRLAVGALGLAVETGGPPARVIEEVSAALRQRQQLDGEARALAAQARLSALVVGLAPIVFAALTCATDRRNAHLMFGTPLGVACVTTGLVLDGVGAVWMHRISESVTR